MGPIFAGNGREVTGNLQADGGEKPKTYTGNGRELVRKNSKNFCGIFAKTRVWARAWPILADHFRFCR